MLSSILYSLLFLSVIGFSLSFLTGLLRKIGLGFISDFLLKMIFYDRDTYMNNYVIWNKIWFRFGLLAGAIIMFSGTIAGIIAKFPTFELERYFKIWRWTAAITTGVYAFEIYKRGKTNKLKARNAKKGSKGFEFKTERGIITLYNNFRGIFISGGAGSGKSKSIIEPIIQQSGTNDYTGVLYDFKFPTLASEAAGSYAKSSIPVYYVNFTDLNRSYRVNPVSPRIIVNSNFARDAASTIITNLDFKAAQKRDFWLQSAEVILAGSIWYLRETHPEFCTLPHAVSMVMESDPKTLIQTLQENEEVKGLISSISSSVESQNQLAGVFSNVQNYLTAINNPDVFWVMSGDEVNFELNHKDNPGFLVVGNDPTLSSTLSPLISLIVSTAIKRMNQLGRVDSVVILDEAPTLFIPNFQQLPATGRSNKIITVYAVQDFAQMEGRLGREESEMIISNLSTQFYFRTTNPQTAARVSSLFGKKDVEYSSYSRGESSKGIFELPTVNKSESTSVQQRDRLEPQQIIRFSPGECAAIIAEGNTDEFIGKFKEQSSKAKEIPAFKNVSDQDKRENFKRIKNEVRGILKINASTPMIEAKAEKAALNQQGTDKKDQPESRPGIKQEANWEDFS